MHDPNFGKLFPCSCRREEIEAATVKKRLEVSNLGALSEKTFDNFIAKRQGLNPREQQNLQRAFDQTKRFAEDPKGWIFLMGPYGVGKTHLAAAIANARLERGEQTTFVTVPDLLDHLRATYSPSSSVGYDELFERVRNVPVLILDDFGTESPTKWAQEKLYQLINHRYTNHLPTVITSNLDVESIEPRIRSRVLDMDMVRNIVISAPDYRRGVPTEQNELSSLSNHQDQTFETFSDRKGEIATEHVRRLSVAIEAAKAYASRPDGWLVLIGGHGSGKTHLAAAIANQQVRLGEPALFVTFADLLDHLRATFSPDSSVRYDKRFNEIRNAPLLILDDMAIESATPWAREKLMQLIDYRYVAKLPTVITTALDRSEMDERLETRLLDPRQTTVCIMTAPIYKGGKKSKPRRR